MSQDARMSGWRLALWVGAVTVIGALALSVLFNVWNVWRTFGAHATTQPHLAAGMVATGADLTTYVNPFIGTAPSGSQFGLSGDSGNTFPGAAYPLGMVQWSPDTPTQQAGGYTYADTQIKDFSLTHFSGRGCTVYQDIPIMPLVGVPTVSPATNPLRYAASFSHTDEQAQPGYYSVLLRDLGVNVELSATLHTGVGRFTFPAAAAATLLINVGGSINGVSDAAVTINPANGEVTGHATSVVGCGANPYTIYFAARFDRPFSGYGVWDGATVTPGATTSADATSGAYVSFDTTSQRVVNAQVGVSFVSVANAADNLAREQPGRPGISANQRFDAARQAARAAWNARLSGIRIASGTPSQLTTFYTALYHVFFHPNVFSDTNGQYRGFDGAIHTVAPGHAQYENITTWDGYRSQIRLLAILAPAETSDIAQSLVNDAQQGDGHLPRWEQANADSHGMNGDGADPYIASAYAFGATQFATADALAAMVHGQAQIREGLRDYRTFGYVTTATMGASAAVTLEYTGDDFAIAQFALALGGAANQAIAQTYLRRAANWRLLFNPQSGYVQPRNADGSWAPGFSPTSDNGFQEGDSAQYTWMAPFDLPTLAARLGGDAAMVSRLDTFFTQLNAGPVSPYAFMGNEPSFEAPWEYDFVGAPAHTQQVVRRIELGLFNATPAGLPGNDDSGALSSWYVFAALGLYPEVQGIGGFVVGSPLFASATLRLAGGKTLRILAPNAAPTAPYVSALTLNGAPTAQLWLSWSAVSGGATLTFALGGRPTAWGSAPADAPPVFLPPGSLG